MLSALVSFLWIWAEVPTLVKWLTCDGLTVAYYILRIKQGLMTLSPLLFVGWTACSCVSF